MTFAHFPMMLRAGHRQRGGVVSENINVGQDGASLAPGSGAGTVSSLGRFAGQFAKTSVPFEVTLPDGRKERFGKGAPSFHVILKNDNAMRAITSVDEGRIGDA